MQTRSAFRNHSGTRGAQNVPAHRAFQNGSGMHYAFAYISHLQIPHHLKEGRGISTVACYVRVLVGKRVLLQEEILKKNKYKCTIDQELWEVVCVYLGSLFKITMLHRPTSVWLVLSVRTEPFSN